MGKTPDTAALGTNENISLCTYHGEMGRLFLPFGEVSKERTAAVCF